MATIVVVLHAADDPNAGGYMISRFYKSWLEAGHKVLVSSGEHGHPAGDIAALHVDMSIVPESYRVSATNLFPLVINGRAVDIRKRMVSRHLVTLGDGWHGPVIVKTDLNCGGIPEWCLYQIGLRTGRSASPARPPTLDNYRVYQRADEVPDAVWNDPALVVEQFLPERDKLGFSLRCWIFLGDRERCTRYWSNEPIIKSSNIKAKEPSPVPDELREARERLGFDYGKFDFAMHDGKPILFDTNKTPGTPPAGPEYDASNAMIAGGLDWFLKKLRGTP